LGDHPIMAFSATVDAARAKAFYRDVLGLPLVADEPYALVFDAHGITLRVQKVAGLTPPGHTVLGWQIPDIQAAVKSLAERGAKFEQFGLPGQDSLGIWSAPGGAKVAWFKDPDGNILSLTQL